MQQQRTLPRALYLFGFRHAASSRSNDDDLTTIFPHTDILRSPASPPALYRDKRRLPRSFLAVGIPAS
jgi:hypothetical protein